MLRQPSPGDFETLPGEPPGHGGDSWNLVMAPLQRLCCMHGQEASEAHDILDTELVPSRLQFGEEETVSPVPSVASISSTLRAAAATPELVERGEVVLEDGGCYRGQWRGSHRHGSGVLVRPSGHSYEGSFEHSHAHGHGASRTPEGSSYEGQWELDLKHGFGKYTHVDGTFYEGEWHLDRKSGRGCEIWADGARYAGEFLKGWKHGVGIYSGLDKNKQEWRYEGQWTDDQIDGEGCYRFGDGRLYCGQWEAGLMAGAGRMDFPDGSCYEGGYARGVKHGDGIFTTAAGVVIKAQWCQGKILDAKGNGTSAGGRGFAAGCKAKGDAPVPVRKGLRAGARGGA